MVMDRIDYHPVRRNLSDHIPSSTTIRDFSTILKFLNANKYITVFDWSIDMTALIYDMIDSTFEGTAKHLIAKEILIWFERKLDNSPKSYQEFTNKRLKKQVRKITNCIEGITAVTILKDTDLEKTISIPELKSLQDMITSISDENTLVNVLFVLKKYIPNLNTDGAIQISQSQVTKQCYYEIENIIKQLDFE